MDKVKERVNKNYSNYDKISNDKKFNQFIINNYDVTIMMYFFDEKCQKHMKVTLLNNGPIH